MISSSKIKEYAPRKEIYLYSFHYYYFGTLNKSATHNVGNITSKKLIMKILRSYFNLCEAISVSNVNSFEPKLTVETWLVIRHSQIYLFNS